MEMTLDTVRVDGNDEEIELVAVEISNEIKKQNKEIAALDELDGLLRTLIKTNADYKERVKTVKRRMRILDQNL